jgi:hypothetical protein
LRHTYLRLADRVYVRSGRPGAAGYVRLMVLVYHDALEGLWQGGPSSRPDFAGV